MTLATVKGMDTLRRRLEGSRAPQAMAQALRQEAEALAAALRAEAPGGLGASIEIREEGRGWRPAYAVGTSHPSARQAEYGTARRPAVPWLMPLFWARSRSLKQRLGKIVGRAVRGL